jgi:hypothetical protein
MKTINRSAVVVIPAQPFLNWLHQADPTSEHLSLNDLRLGPTISLLPDYDTEEEAHEHLQRRYKEILNNNWMAGIVFQPPGLLIGASKISSTGEYRFHSVLIDLCSHPIIWDEL